MFGHYVLSVPWSMTVAHFHVLDSCWVLCGPSLSFAFADDFLMISPGLYVSLGIKPERRSVLVVSSQGHAL